ncbi:MULTISPECIES: hypothetical protein [Gammaproteobacteria]|uniref:hypothetical protein n=1 Tax=Gammaproteobacteria TaxID=1236 RepID=UPI000DCF68A2|nr:MULTISPECIES: hypothetical protein [Gammaproteobacteria]RTE86480.1 hypothetical protein DQX04_07955 [Aliidiomarina sp. B3213]TCZ90965.1 hypothetical protein EYQ95_09090 [Lysobacter sp. N42]
MSTPQQTKNRRTLLIVAAIFILPVAVAKLFFEMGWYNSGASNLGNLITPPLKIEELENEQLPNTWRIAMQVPEGCGAPCDSGLYVLSQTDHALGRMTDRVTPVGILPTMHDDLPELPADSNVVYQALPNTYEQLSTLPANSLYIIDPVGNIVMWYEGSADREYMIMQARDLLKDLKKMLKMSRVG